MKKLLAVFLLCNAAVIAPAKEYGNYDMKRVATVEQSAPDGPTVSFHAVYLDQVLQDLGSHAGIYPPTFDRLKDRRASRIKNSAGECKLSLMSDC